MRELLAYGMSLLLHASALAALYLAADALPRAWQQRPGRARIELQASTAATLQPSPLDEVLKLIRETEPHKESPLEPTAATPQRERRETTLSLARPTTELRTESIAAAANDEPYTRAVIAEAAPRELRPTPPAKRPPAHTAVAFAAVASTASPSSEAADGAEVDEQPKKLPNNPSPRYPSAARAGRQAGVVVLMVVVAADGSAESVELHTTSGFPLLDDAAIDAVRRWRFEPARKAGLAVSTSIYVPVRFVHPG